MVDIDSMQQQRKQHTQSSYFGCGNHTLAVNKMCLKMCYTHFSVSMETSAPSKLLCREFGSECLQIGSKDF